MGRVVICSHFKHRVRGEPSRSLPEAHVSRGHPERRARRDHENVVGEPIPGIHGHHEGRTPFLPRFTGDRHPVEAPAKRGRAHDQVSPRARDDRPAHSESSARSFPAQRGVVAFDLLFEAPLAQVPQPPLQRLLEHLAARGSAGYPITPSQQHPVHGHRDPRLGHSHTSYRTDHHTLRGQSGSELELRAAGCSARRCSGSASARKARRKACARREL